MAEDRPRCLLYDIETSPNIGATWGKYKQNVVWFEEQWYILSFAYKWLGERQTHVLALPDFPLYKKEPHNDRELVTALRDLFREADVTVTYNGISFDNKKAQTRMAVHNLDPPGWYKEVDLLRVARKQFAFTSNRLTDVCQVLGLPAKEDSGGAATWKGCRNGDPKAWERMRRYNKKDVVILENLYKRMTPWLVNYPHMGAFKGRPDNCPKCGNGPLIVRGYKYNQVTRRVSFQCKSCGGYSMGRKLEPLPVLTGER